MYSDNSLKDLLPQVWATKLYDVKSDKNLAPKFMKHVNIGLNPIWNNSYVIQEYFIIRILFKIQNSAPNCPFLL